MTLLLTAVMGAWAADVCTATQTITNGRKTCTWTELNVSVAKNASKGGDGLYFVAGSGGTITTSSGAVNIKSGRIMYVQVPSASSTGTLTITGSGDKYTGDDVRTVKLNSEATIAMKTAGASADFVTTDIENVNGGYYIKVTSTSDFKFNKVAVTLTSAETYPYAPSLAVTPSSVTLSATAGTTSPTATFTLTGSDLNEMDGSAITFASSVEGLTVSPSTITVTDGTIAEANRTYTITYAPSANVAAADVVLNIVAKKGGEDIATAAVTVNYVSNISDTEAPTLVSSTPADNATGLNSAVNVTFTFDEDVQLAAGAVFALTGGAGAFGITSIDGATITIPISGLAFGTTYTLELAANKVEDLAGNSYAAALSKTFTTMDAPAASKTWDFTADMSSTDVANLDADVAAKTGWVWEEASSRYKNKSALSSEILVANGKPVELTAGLKFTTSGSDGIRLDKSQQVILNGAANKLIIPALKVGDEITITFASNGGSAGDRNISLNNSSLIFGSTTSNINTDTKTAIFKVTTAGDITVSVSNGMRFYSISVATNSDNAVTVTSAGYATGAIASNIDFTKSAGVKAYKAVLNGEGTEVNLVEVDAAPAGTALIIEASADSYLLTEAADTPAAVTGNDLKVAATDMTQSSVSGTMYVLNKVGGVVGFYKLSATGTLKAGKCYIEIPPGSPAPDMLGLGDVVDESDITTGISAIEHSTLNIEHSEVYNLNGQRVSQPTKGLYIVNGKKVVVK